MMLLEVPLLYKIRNNGKPKTIAVIGAADKEISSERVVSSNTRCYYLIKIQKHCQTSTTHFWQTITILISKNVLRY
jgi:hypothetical protein